MNEKFLVTGANGFVGACLVRELVSQNKEVYVLLRSKKLSWRISDLKDKLHIIECDLQSPKLPSIINSLRPDYIFHLAVYGASPDQSDINQMIDINIKGTINLVNAALQNPFKLFINTGSSSEYGTKDVPMKETDILDPVNDYGITKSAATLYCTKIGRRENVPLITFRLFSPFGYYESGNRLIPSVIINALENKQITVSSPKNVRDFLFIEDTVNAYLHATKSKVKPGDVYNIGSGKQHSVKDVINGVLRITKSKSKVKWDSTKTQSRQVEPPRWEADMSKTSQELKWIPTFTLKDGLAKTITWFKENKQLYE